MYAFGSMRQYRWAISYQAKLQTSTKLCSTPVPSSSQAGHVLCTTRAAGTHMHTDMLHWYVTICTRNNMAVRHLTLHIMQCMTVFWSCEACMPPRPPFTPPILLIPLRLRTDHCSRQHKFSFFSWVCLGWRGLTGRCHTAFLG